MLTSTKFGILAVVVGLFCLLIGGLMFFLADDIAAEGQRMTAHANNGEAINWDTWQTHVQWIYGGMAVAGVVSLVAAFGLFAGREWARKTWLILAAVLCAFHIAWFLFDRSEWLTALIALAIAVYSWIDLTRSDAKALFQ